MNINNILKLRLDDKITELILQRTDFFKYIHPNIITLFGLILNFVILNTLLSHKTFICIVLLVLRYFADCLDGGVARKYSKKSKLGGALDTWSDTILIYVLVYGFFKINNFPYGSELAAFVSCANLYIMSLSNSLVDHAGMKLGGSIITKIYAFFVNNSFITFSVIIVILVNLQ